MRVVDFHAHYFGRTFFETLAAQSPLAGNVEEKLARVVERTGIDLPSAVNAEHSARWIAELDAIRVEHMCAFASVPEEVPSVCEAARESRGRLSAFAIVNPRVDGAAAKIRALLEKRAIRGVLCSPRCTTTTSRAARRSRSSRLSTSTTACASRTAASWSSSCATL
jgi:hypothetical protein